MAIPVELRQLRERLQDIGMVVVEEPEWLVVRLPYFCSVRIHFVEGHLRFEPHLGMLPRTRATMTKLLGFTFLTVAAMARGLPLQAPIALATIGIMASIYDAIRVVVTEGVITRASAVYSGLVHGQTANALPTQQTRAIGAPNPTNVPPPTFTDAHSARLRGDG